MISLALVGEREVVARLQQIPGAMHEMLHRRVWELTLRLKARVQRKLSGEVLNVVTGALRRSIQANIEDSGASVTGLVYSTGDVKYARIHEFGGKTRAHVIEPKKAAALMFAIGGSTIFARRVNHPGSKIPERSFLRSSMGDMREEIIRVLTEGILAVSRGEAG